MKNLYLIIVISLLSSLMAFSQQQTLFMNLGKPLTTQKGINTNGSAYLNAEFQEATVTTTDGKELKGVDIRYNILNQHIEYSSGDNAYDITDMVSKFNMLSAIENHTGKFTKIQTFDMKAPSFLELVYTDTIGIYKLNTLKVESEEDFYTKKVVKKYVPSNTFYILSNNTFQKIGSTKKDFQSAFRRNERTKSILESSDFSFSADTSVIALGKAINGR
jgi:hypothetical protein